MVYPIIRRFAIAAPQEHVYHICGVRYNPHEHCPRGVDLRPDPCLQANFHGAQLSFDFCHGPLGTTICLRIVCTWILDKGLMDAVCRYLLLDGDERKLTVGLENHLPVAELVHGFRHALGDCLVAQPFCI